MFRGASELAKPPGGSAMKRAWILVLLALVTLPGCWFFVGAGTAGGGYEYVNKRKLEQLDRDFEEGKLSREEYLRRKREIESGSVVQIGPLDAVAADPATDFVVELLDLDA